MTARRRRLLLWLGAGALAAGAAAYWPLRRALVNPCLADLPDDIAAHPLLQAVWDGLDATQVWDMHVHLVGTGDSDSGIRVHPDMYSVLEPLQFAQRLFYLNAGCVHDAPGRADRSYVERLRNLMHGLRPGAKLLLFAFERMHDESGRADDAHTRLYVPNAYARTVALSEPQSFAWAASIHPYRADCVDALEQAVADGARAIKWLPAAMGMDPASPLCGRFYAALARLRLPLITHAGAERAVPSAHAQHYGNPLRLRRALDAGVRVVVAHCASLGEDRDLDRGGESGPLVPSFDLFARLMDDAHYGARLHGDLSALTLVNRDPQRLPTIIERSDWHARLLNGSDYPLPGVIPFVSPNDFVRRGLMAPDAAALLERVRDHNPLLFDLALKRLLRHRGAALPAQVFETRRFFELGDTV